MTDMSDGQAAPPDWRGALRASVPRLAVGTLLGLVALWLAFRGVDWSATWLALRSADYTWVSLALLSTLLTLAVVTLRWRVLFYPHQRECRLPTLFNGIVVGQMLNIIVPARLGEVARAYLVGTKQRMKKARVLATIVVEKAVDMTMFALSLIVLLLGMSVPTWMLRSSNALLVGSGMAIGMTLALSFWGETGLHWLARFAHRLPAGIGRFIRRYVQPAVDGFSSLRHWSTHLWVWSLSLGVLVLAATTNFLLFQAFDLPLPPIAALFLLVVLQVGNAPPSLPGKLGVFHYLTIVGLSVFGVDRSVALSYAFALYAVALLPKIILGAIILARFRWQSDK